MLSRSLNKIKWTRWRKIYWRGSSLIYRINPW